MAPISERVTLVKNALFSAITASSNVLLLVLFMIAARVLGVEDLGILSTGMAVGAAVTFGLDFGINPIAIRRISASQFSVTEVAGWLLSWRLILCGLFLLVFIPVVWLVMDDSALRNTVMLFGVAGVLRSANFSCRALLHATGRFSMETKVVLTDTTLLISIGLFVLYQGAGPLVLAIVFVGVRTLVLLIYLSMVSRYISSIKWGFNWRAMWHLQVESIPLGISVLLGAFFWQTDILLLSALAGTYFTGIYSAAFRIIEGTRVGPDALANVFYPRLSHFQNVQWAQFDDLLARGCKYVMVIGGGVACFGVTFAKDIILLLYGNEYQESIWVFMVLAVLPGIFFIGQYLTVGMRALGRQKAIVVVQGVGLTTKLLLGGALIPSLGLVGAVLAALAATVALTVTAVIMVAQARPESLGAVKPLPAITLAAGITIVVGMLTSNWPLLVSGLLVGVIYLAALSLLGVFDQHELALLTQLKAKLFFSK